ncbi:FtsQ-type POTRA domain-containing protein [Agromyces sp. SYSU T0242]|uniref:FtsQ-type POTRA domain-containing protein n=1 Tax=Agromyces litoreus TaxID=3158561 RepID=UPI00339A0556
MTEPIALPTASPARKRGRERGAEDSPPKRPATSPDTSREGGARGDAAQDRRTRRRLASAERARRRVERQEVRRFTRRSRLRRATWITVLASVVGVAIAAVVVAYSPIMALREVRVEGTSRIAAADVRAAFAGDLGTPLALIAPDEVQDALSAFPLIETYSIESVPPGTLVVRIVERTPVGVIEGSGGLVSVDAAGVVVERLDGRPEQLPAIVVEDGVDSAAFRAAGRVLRNLPEGLRTGIASISAASADDVRFELGSGATVVWGNEEESSLKGAVLQRLMDTAPPGTVTRYDVSAPLYPVVE